MFETDELEYDVTILKAKAKEMVQFLEEMKNKCFPIDRELTLITIVREEIRKIKGQRQTRW